MKKLLGLVLVIVPLLIAGGVFGPELIQQVNWDLAWESVLKTGPHVLGLFSMLVGFELLSD